MLRAFRDGAWQRHRPGASSPAQAAVAARAACARPGCRAGDRVVIVRENRPEYPIAETALMAIRAVPVPAYTTNTVEDHAQSCATAAPRAAIVSTAHARRPAAAGGARPAGSTCWWSMDGRRRPPGGTPRVLPLGRRWSPTRAPPDDIAAEAATIPPRRAGLPDLHLGHRRRAARA